MNFDFNLFKSLPYQIKTESNGHTYIVKFDNTRNELAVKALADMVEIAKRTDSPIDMSNEGGAEIPESFISQKPAKKIKVSLSKILAVMKLTGKTMSECKTALLATNGDITKAIKLLKS